MGLLWWLGWGSLAMRGGNTPDTGFCRTRLLVLGSWDSTGISIGDTTEIVGGGRIPSVVDGLVFNGGGEATEVVVVVVAVRRGAKVVGTVVPCTIVVVGMGFWPLKSAVSEIHISCWPLGCTAVVRLREEVV